MPDIPRGWAPASAVLHADGAALEVLKRRKNIQEQMRFYELLPSSF